MKQVFNGAKEVYGFKGAKLDVQGHKFLITDGLVGVYAGSNPEHSIFSYIAGEIFPLADFGKLHSKRPLEYRPLFSSRLLVLQEKEFYCRLHEFGSEDKFIQLNSGILARAFQRIDNLGFTSVQQRLYYHLEYLAEQFGQEFGGRIIINIPITHVALAASINTSRETVNRIFQKLEKQGVIVFEKQTLVISSVDQLGQILLAGTVSKH